MRKNFLVKPQLQIKHLLWTLSLIAISCFVGYMLFESMVKHAFYQNGFTRWDWMPMRDQLRLGFVVILALLLAAVGLESYLLFHRFVGPLFALEKGLKKLTEGDMDYVTRIRDYDQLGDLIRAFEDMKSEMRHRLGAQEKLAQVLIKELDRLLVDESKPDLKDVRNQLLEIRKLLGKKTP